MLIFVDASLCCEVKHGPRDGQTPEQLEHCKSERHQRMLTSIKRKRLTLSDVLQRMDALTARTIRKRAEVGESVQVGKAKQLGKK
jgi:hypothetical protein